MTTKKYRDVLVRLAVCAAVAVPAGCGIGRDTEPPVATPAVSLNRAQAPLGSPVEFSYRFTVSPAAPAFDRDHRVMVHFLDMDGDVMWTDDHDPPVPTSQWRPGQTIAYDRIMFIPIYPYLGPATIAVGLYEPDTGRRLPLGGEPLGQRAYGVGSLVLQPQSENIFVMFRDGWHGVEFSPDNPAVEWQWTRSEATATFRNPRRDVTIWLHLDGPSGVLDESQQVTLLVAGQPLETIELGEGVPAVHQIVCPAGQLGDEDIVELRLQVSETFVPAELGTGSDTRELGVRVFHLFVEPR